MTEFDEPVLTDGDIYAAEVRKSLNLVANYTLENPPKPTAKPITQTETYQHTYVTHNKHKLTMREAKFIDAYMAHGDEKQAVLDAGYKIKVKNARGKGKWLLSVDYIADEIAYRQDILRSAQVADRHEILSFLTAVMRGEVKDQFNLEATLRDRLDAGEKLAKRLIDDPMKMKQNVAAQQVVVNIDFNRDEEVVPVVDVQQLSD